MKRIIVLVLIGFLAVQGLLAQNFADPLDPVYQDLDQWSRRRIVGPLPQMRPYEIQTIKPLLEKVLASGKSTEQDKLRAQGYLDRIGDGFHAGVDFVARFQDDAAGPYAHGAFSAQSTGMYLDVLSLDLDLKLYGLNRDYGTLEAPFSGIREDYIEDWSDVGGILIRQTAHTFVGLGEPGGAFRFFAGYGRQDFGPFAVDGLVAGPHAPSSGRFSLLVTQPEFDFTMALYELTATNDAGDTSAGVTTGKHVFLHDLTLHPLPWLDFGLFETVISGGRFEMLYLIPLCSYFEMQGVGGFTDNTLVGFDLTAKPVEGLDIKGLVYLDDLHFNDILQFNWNTKWKLAWQAGVSWSPTDKAVADHLRSLDFDYTAVMPYMYTHWDGDSTTTVNYTNYSHQGVNFGPDLKPNSGRFNLRGRFSLFQDKDWGSLDADLGLMLVSHGNASADIITGADGGLFDPGYLGTTPTFQPPFVDPTGQPYTRFLTQDVLEHTFQAALDFHWLINQGKTGDRAWGRLGVDLGYTYEHVWNAGLVAGLEVDNHYLKLGVNWLY